MSRRSIPGVFLVISATAIAIAASCSAGTGGPRNIADIPIPNVDAGTNFAFDISAVDSDAGLYYFTDRNNKAVDVINVKTNTLVTQITGGFAGCFLADGGAVANCAGADNSQSGPDGLNLITGTNLLYTGDVGSVKIIDRSTNKVTKTVSVITSGSDNPKLRADEGCFDPDDKLFMISSPEQSPPFATFIDTATGTIVGRINFKDPQGAAAGGLEACVYDPGTKSFYVNNDGTTSNPHGEVDVIPASFISTTNFPNQNAINNGVTLPPAGNGFKVYPEGDCDPTGLDLGPGNDLAISCREGTVGSPLNFLVMDKTSGTILATVNAGGADQIAYDPVTNRYYAAASRWNPTGKVTSAGGTCTSTNLCTPVVQIIDASSRKLVGQILTGNNAHSIAVSGPDHKFFMPYSSGTSPAGCRDCPAAYPNGGVSVLQTE
jgi:hypothetical protein